MKKLLNITKIALGIALFFSLSACQNITIPNPFDTSPSVSNEQVSKGQFADIPVPADMKLVSDKTKVTLNSQNLPIGLETYSSTTDTTTVSNAMILNMAKNNWSLIASVSGDKYVQLHAKDSRYAIIYIEKSLIGAVLEIWVFTSLGQAQNMINSYAPAYSGAAAPQNTQNQGQAVEHYSEQLHN